MPGFLKTLNLLRRTITRSIMLFMKKQLMFIAGYMAFMSFLSLFPFLIFLVAMAGMIGDATLATTLINKLLVYMPQSVVNAIAPGIRNIIEGEPTGLLTLGTIGTLWAASAGVEALRTGLNNVYDVKEVRPFVKRRGENLVVVVCAAVVALVLSVGIIAWPLILATLESLLNINLTTLKIWDGLRFPVIFMLLATAFAGLYKFLPNTKHRRCYYPGSYFAAGGWLLLASLFSTYLRYAGNYSVTYGSLGGVIVSLLFFQFSSAMVLLGAIFNRVWAARHGDKPSQDLTKSDLAK